MTIKKFGKAPPVACECGDTNTGVMAEPVTSWPTYVGRTTIADGATVVFCTLTVTVSTTFVVMAVIAGESIFAATDFNIERGGVDVTDERYYWTGVFLRMGFWECCERLDPGTYTWSLVNRSGDSRGVGGARIKVRAVG